MTEPGTDPQLPILTYDPEWLAITRAFHPYLSTKYAQSVYPDENTARAMIRKELEWVQKNVRTNSGGSVAPGIKDIRECQLFVMTAPPPSNEDKAKSQLREFSVPFCQPVSTFHPGLNGLCSGSGSALVY